MTMTAARSALCAAGLTMMLSLTAMAQESSKMGAGGGIELTELISRFAKRNHKQVIIDPRVRAIVSLAGVDPAELSYDQLLAILDVHQFVAVEVNGVISIVPDANARQLPVPVYDDLRFKALEHELVTLLVQPKNVCASHLVPVLRPLMPQSAHLAAEMQTNTLIISDRSVNARRIAELVGQLDRRGNGKGSCQAPEIGRTSAPAPAKPAG